MSTAYLTSTEAKTLIAATPGMSVLAALTDDALATSLLLASMDIDTAMPYQGRKYDLLQEREFPRVPYGPPAGPQAYPTSLPLSRDNQVWDWDSDGSAAVVPLNVKMATLWQAVFLQDSGAATRLEAIRSGLASQQIGSAQESYLKPADIDDTGLCSRAARIMNRYRIRTGRVL